MFTHLNVHLQLGPVWLLVNSLGEPHVALEVPACARLSIYACRFTVVLLYRTRKDCQIICPDTRTLVSAFIFAPVIQLS
jgi:hypothetical protein